ncbi:hypothetical protein GW17_00041237 [Ensete ventricosum]|nr:hypothetical protein GW17_00041237 [Ensete ventricosum]RZR79332.1 hypothetical protein BHM03_00005037 [Ensete ventricosum]
MKAPFPHRKRSFRSYLFTISFIIFIIFLYGEDFTCILSSPAVVEADLDAALEKDEAVAFAVGKTVEECDVFQGEWVYDEVSRPQYAEEECLYIQPQLTCQAHGRPDAGYEHWRWQPHGCSLPSFNATLTLEMLRGKRMLFVGDSLNRGQFVSMVCLLHRVIPENAKSMETFDSLTVFTAKVRLITDRIVRAGSIMKHARYWKGADIVVFNTYLWRGSFDADPKNITEMVTEDAYRLALGRMLKWVEKQMDPHTTRVFFATMSPSHERSAT